jgi:hypothetical protein
MSECTYLRWGAAWESVETMRDHRSREIAGGGTMWHMNLGVSCVANDDAGRRYLMSLIERTINNGDGVLRGCIFELTGEQIGKCRDGQPLIRVVTCRRLTTARAWYDRHGLQVVQKKQEQQA